MNLTDKVAIVTGAGRGIGRGIARALARAGAKVVVNYAHSEKEAGQLVELLRAEGGEAMVCKADVSSVAEIRRMVGEALERYGQIDILVNNAAIDTREDVFQITEAFWDHMIGINLKGAFFCSQLCAEQMRQAGRGRIINISSVHGHSTMPRYAAYAASKGGINALTRQLALDLAAWQITVNAVAPGATEVERFLHEDWFDRERIGKQIPLGRIGRPDDVAALAVFLASDEAEFITGQVITVDGGSSTKFPL